MHGLWVLRNGAKKRQLYLERKVLVIMSFGYEPFGTSSEEEKKDLILYARCFDEKMAQIYIYKLKSYVSKMLVEFIPTNVTSSVPEYKIYIPEKDVDSLIGLFNEGVDLNKKEVHL